MRPTRLLKSGIFAGLLVLAFPAPAWYQVEVIVFETLRPNPDGELFAENSGLPETEGAVELTATGATGANPSPFAAYRVITPSRYRLGGVYGSLRSSQDYRPLLHVAWEQPGSGEGPTRLVHVERSAGLESGGAGVAAAAADLSATAPAAARIVDGTVRVRSGRFLHVDVDMAYFPEAGVLDPESRVPSPDSRHVGPVRIQTSRKIKLNELHYLDHPLFGVLIEVSRLRIDLPAAQVGDQPDEGAGESAEETTED
ncbi:MAG: hypothetical protein HYY48_08720 [Gammaproteobacteria bacterium]|nr:hypothetical protein [Gammaproteobacteria bacterium]